VLHLGTEYCFSALLDREATLTELVWWALRHDARNSSLWIRNIYCTRKTNYLHKCWPLETQTL